MLRMKKPPRTTPCNHVAASRLPKVDVALVSRAVSATIPTVARQATAIPPVGRPAAVSSAEDRQARQPLHLAVASAAAIASLPCTFVSCMHTASAWVCSRYSLPAFHALGFTVSIAHSPASLHDESSRCVVPLQQTPKG